MNYYFLSSALATQLIGQDNANHLITQVTSGQTEQSEVQVNNVTITSMTQEKVENTILSRGTALETFDLIYSGADFQQAAHGALDGFVHLLPESRPGERAGQDKPAVRDDQSSRSDHHRVSRKPRLGRSSCRPGFYLPTGGSR